MTSWYFENQPQLLVEKESQQEEEEEEEEEEENPQMFAKMLTMKQ
jgi:hypothetical protein